MSSLQMCAVKFLKKFVCVCVCVCVYVFGRVYVCILLKLSNKTCIVSNMTIVNGTSRQRRCIQVFQAFTCTTLANKTTSSTTTFPNLPTTKAATTTFTPRMSATTSRHSAERGPFPPALIQPSPSSPRYTSLQHNHLFFHIAIKKHHKECYYIGISFKEFRDHSCG